MTSKILLAAAAVGLIAGTGLAQKAVSRNDDAKRISPIRVAKARLVNGQVKIIGEWKPVLQRPQFLDQMWLGAFDAGEFGPDGIPTGTRYGTDNGDGRWWFGPEYGNTAACGNMTVKPGYAGKMGTISGFQWAQIDANGNGVVESYHTIISVFTAEDFDDTGAGPAFDNPYDGVAYDFGNITDGGTWYAAPIELASLGLGHMLPTDGTGALLWLFGTTDGAGGFVLNTTGQVQPLLWGSEVAGTFPASPGTRTEWQWDDDNPRDGAYTAPDELYSYAFGVDPDPLGTAIALYTHEAVVLPSTVEFIYAQNTSGGAAEAAEDDDQFVVAQRGFAPTLGVDVPQIDFTGGQSDYGMVKVANGGPGYATGNVKAVYKAGSTIFVRTYIRNQSTSTWELLDQTATTPNVKVTKNLALTGTMDDYISNSGNVAVKIGGRRHVAGLVVLWTISVDQIRTTLGVAP